MLNKVYGDINTGIVGLEKALLLCEKEGDSLKEAKLCASKGTATLEKLRLAVDVSEGLVADELWPLAKYQELLLVL